MAATSDGGQYVIARAEAQQSQTLLQAGAVLAAVLCIALAALMQPAINARRTELRLILNSDIYKSLPPKYAWVSAVGATFRGLAADFLWTRLEELKQEGKYYEAHQLAKWICTVQPQYPEVWSFQAWNMSYNISVGTKTERERWQWVYNGIRLLRDEGIPNNENLFTLYEQLAWTWFHKVGEQMDDFHWYYKRVWAATMEQLLGRPPVAVPDEQAIAWFKPVAEAPVSLDALLAERPAVAERITDLNQLGVDVNAGTDAGRIRHPLEESFFKPYTRWLMQQERSRFVSKARQQDEQQQRFGELLARIASPDFDALVAFLRAKVLREQYKMDPGFMLKMTGMLGTDQPIPIDWRTPWSQGLYWGLYGSRVGDEWEDKRESKTLKTDRIVLFSLAKLAKNGRFVFRLNPDNEFRSFLDMTPDIRFIEAMHLKYIELGRKHADPGEDVEGRTSEMLRSGHVNNLHDAIVALYFAGHTAEAQKYLEYLAKYYKDPDTGRTKAMYIEGVYEFVRSQVKEMADSYQNARFMMHSMLMSGYMRLAEGDANEFATRVNLARTLIYEPYQQDKLDDPQGRRTMPPFDEIRASALFDYVAMQRQYPLYLRALVWERENIAIRRMIYDEVRMDLQAECDAAGYDMARAFPEPPGMEQHRRDHPPVRPEDVVERERQKASGGNK